MQKCLDYKMTQKKKSQRPLWLSNTVIYGNIEDHRIVKGNVRLWILCTKKSDSNFISLTVSIEF